jgi:hypothetical protein
MATPSDTTPAPCAQQHPDADIIALTAQWHAAVDACNTPGCDDDEADRLNAIWNGAEHRLSEMQPATTAGAAAQLRHVLTSMQAQLGAPDEYTTPGERCWLGSLSGVLGFLEARA